MNITDKKLRDEKIISEEERIAIRYKPDGKEEWEYPKRKFIQNTADWVVSKFCYICPHREA